MWPLIAVHTIHTLRLSSEIRLAMSIAANSVEHKEPGVSGTSTGRAGGRDVRACATSGFSLP